MPEGNEARGVVKFGDVILTTLKASNRGGDDLEVTPLDEPTDDGLQFDRSGGLANTLHECPSHDDTPPGLNPDRSPLHRLVLLLSHTPPHVLLNDDNQRVESLRTQRFESGQHSGSEKNLREPILVFVGVVDSLFQDQGTQLLEFEVLYHGGPICRRDEHVISWGENYNPLQETRVRKAYRSANSSYVQREGYPAQLMRIVSRTPQARNWFRTC